MKSSLLVIFLQCILYAPLFSQQNKPELKYIEFALDDSVFHQCLTNQLKGNNFEHFIIQSVSDTNYYPGTSADVEKSEKESFHNVRILSFNKKNSKKISRVNIDLVVDDILNVYLTINENKDGMYIRKLKARSMNGDKRKSYNYISNN